MGFRWFFRSCTLGIMRLLKFPLMCLGIFEIIYSHVHILLVMILSEDSNLSAISAASDDTTNVPGRRAGYVKQNHISPCSRPGMTIFLFGKICDEKKI